MSIQSGALAAATEQETRRPQKPTKAQLSEGKRAERNLGLLLCAPAAIIIVLVTAYPIGYALWLSLQRYDLRFPAEQAFVGLSNYVTVLTSGYWWQAFGVTMLITVISVAIEFVVGLALALLMHRTLVARGLVRTVVLIPYGIVTVVAAFSWQFAWTPDKGYLAALLPGGSAPLTEFGSALAIVILAEVWKTTPFMALLLLAGLVVVLYALIPVLWILSLSFKTTDTITDGNFIPRSWTLDNYAQIFSLDIFTRALVNSIGISIIATVLAVVIGTMAAYAIARLDFPGKKVLVGVSLLIAMFPQISLVSPLFDIERAVGLFDTWPGLILPYITFALPLAIYTLSAFFREIPWELEKAAKMDGATPLQAFRSVIVPLAAPGVFTTAILVFIFCWNDFLFAISLTSTLRSQTATVAIANFTGASQFAEPTGSIAAAAVLLTIPIIIFVLLFQRRIVAGLTSGAVKG
jgi:multiple sugar transport system permease protein